MVKSI